MERFVLDTGMLLGFVLDAPWALWARSEFSLGDRETMVFTSVICRGELLALAEKRGWGEGKRERLEEVLRKFPALDINREDVLKAYALIDAWTHGNASGFSRTRFPASQASSPDVQERYLDRGDSIGERCGLVIHG